jgi:ligand-binding sensor domain-containing protein
MWLTDQDNQCVIRYDGTQMRRFVFDPTNPNSLGGRYPEYIMVDSTGIIWIAFHDRGFDRYDPESDRFTHFRHRSEDTASLACDTVTSLLLDHLGNLWAGTDEGLDLLDQKSGRFRHFRHNDKDTTSLSHNVVRVLYEDREGTIWVGTGYPWLIEPVDKGGLNRLHRETGTFTRYLHDPGNSHSLISNKVRSIFEDSRGVFWVGTAGDGLHTMDRNSGVFERHTYDPAKPDQISRSPVKGIDDHITFITEDALGCLWIGTWANGMIRWDPRTKKKTQFGGQGDTAGTFKDKSCWWAWPTKDGLLWISTQEPNFYKIELFTNTFYRNLTHVGAVHSFYEESPNVLWIAADSGFYRKDQKTGIYSRYLDRPLNAAARNGGAVGSIVRDQQGDFWLGTTGAGLIRFNPETGVYVRFRHDDKNIESLCSDEINALYLDSTSELWVGTLDGLDKLDITSGKIIHYRKNEKDSTSLSKDQLTCLLKEGPDILWVGAYYGGLNKMNLQSGKCRHYLPIAYVTYLYRDEDGTLWVGTTNGLYRYNRKTDDFSLFGEGNSGLSINSVVSIIGDLQHNMWMASTSGIYRLNQSRDHVILYDERNGVNGISTHYSLGTSAAARGQNGEILLGSLAGYYAFFPDRLRFAASTPKLEISGLWLKGQPVKPGERPLEEPLYRSKALQLKHDENAISIGFSAIDYDNPGDKAFSYKLVNFDDNWRLSGPDQRAYYYNLSPGKYVFRVKILNSNTGKSDEAAIDIVIAAPWWKSWWAYGLYVVLPLVGFIFFIRIQRRRIILKERERGMLKDLEMQVLRAQMNPHFLFNCLSSINNFIMKNETEQASDYLTKFSRLMRTVLNNSKNAYISLEDELEMLGLYLDLEKLRFGNRFSYCIDMDRNVDPLSIFIPPLLFQPFVENAVWHGLVHKTDRDGKLKITLQSDGKTLVCLIEDNGVGRASARDLESKSAEKNKSMGIQITRQRLELINSNGEIAGNEFLIEDLFDRAGRAAGTKVSLRINYKDRKDAPG